MGHTLPDSLHLASQADRLHCGAAYTAGMRGCMGRCSTLFTIVLWAAAIMCVVWLANAVIPLQDDELMHHRLLRCMQPGTAISPQDDCTGFWDLNLFGTGLLLPLRVFWYSGVPPAFFYAPLYFVWHEYGSVRLLGALFLLAQAWLLSRAYAVRTWWVFAGLLAIFPYAVQHLVDTGPVGYAITSVYALQLLFRRWAAERRMRWGLYAAAVAALGVWIKLVYLWLVPGLLLLWLVEMRTVPARKRITVALQAAISLVFALALLAPFLLSTDPYQAGKLVVLEQLTTAKTHTLSFLFGNPLQVPALRLLFHPLATVHRLFVLPPAGVADGLFSLLSYVLPLCTACLLALQCRGAVRAAAVRSLIFALAFWMTLLFIARAQQTWAMHHVILAFPFLVLSACELLSALRQLSTLARRRTVAVLVVFVAVNVLLYLRLPTLSPRSETDWSRTTVHAVLADDALSRRYIYVTLDLGMYFYQTTFGPWHQVSIFRQPLHQAWQVEQLREFSSQSGRKLLFYYDTKARMSDMDLLQREFALRRCNAIPPDAVWQILYEPDGNSAHPCSR